MIESGERRRVIQLLALGSAAATLAGHALAAPAGSEQRVTAEMIRHAEWLSGLRFSDGERKLMLKGVRELVTDLARLRAVALDNAVPPALQFQPLATPGDPGAADTSLVPRRIETSPRPAAETDVAYAGLAQLSAWLRSGQISATELTRLYLDRLGRMDPRLSCVVHTTEERALEQAQQADRELAAGRSRGPLHGIPWGAKDLLAVPGYPTTWGAGPYREQERPELASVVARLDEAGAVLVAKLSLGELAWGDEWFGGTTKNPWKLAEGSSGSSAGSAAATAAGLVGFALGSETWGSIVSPCTRCGVTGLRPTFGRVSRHGAMALSWSMDKLGPIARSAEDCALVFSAIAGPDGMDPSVAARPFPWPFERDLRTLRVGYLPALFDEDRGAGVDDPKERARAAEWQAFDLATLKTVQELGWNLVPIELPTAYPVTALGLILSVEAAAAFDDLTRSGVDARLVRQVEQAWPNVLRQAQLVPAVDYVRANRVRTLLMRATEQALASVDAFIAPSFGGDHLLLTNLTGHPAVVLPNGFRASDGTPTSITLTGRLHGEAPLLALAHAFQQATDFHLRRPPLEETSS